MKRRNVLLALATAATVLILSLVFMPSNKVQSDKVDTVKMTQNIRDRVQIIQMYRELNKQDCKTLGVTVPYDLVASGICAKPE